MLTKYYVYGHFKKDTKEVFYIGKGSNNRLNCKQRSTYWKRIVNKHGFYAEKLADNLTEKEAFNFEILLISQLRKNKINLCNLSEGGEGCSGYKHSKEHIEYMKKRMLGVKNAKGCKRTEEYKKQRAEQQKKEIRKTTRNGQIVGRRAQFSDDLIIEIRNSETTPEIRHELALKFNVTYQAISAIQKRKVYKYVQ